MLPMIGPVRVKPPKEKGDWRVKEVVVTKERADFDNFRNTLNGASYLRVTPGKYVVLTCQGEVIMSNTDMERRTHYAFVDKAAGNVLINGLGLGMALHAALLKDTVKHVTVIEKSPDVLAMIAPDFIGERVTFIEADAFAFQPPKGVRYGAVWHDIWPTVSEDNLPEMHKLVRKYARRAAWQGCWARPQCERAREMEGLGEQNPRR